MVQPSAGEPGRDDVAVQPVRFVAEAHAQRPRLGLDPHRHLQHAAPRRDQAALHEHRHEHDDEDDVVDLAGCATPAAST